VTEQSEFDRGHTAGEISARLAGHDQHFAQINGSIARLADEMHQMVLAVQQLSIEATAREATVVTTAAALKTADDARRNADKASWSPLARFLAAIAGAAALASVVIALIQLR